MVLAAHTWGSSWSSQKVLFHCDKQAMVDIWDKGSTRAPHTLAWFACCIFVLVITTYKYTRNSCSNSIADFFLFTDGEIQDVSPQCNAGSRTHPCMANAKLHNHLLQCQYHGIAQSTRRTYESGLLKFHSFCHQYNLTQVPASSLTLHYFLLTSPYRYHTRP